MELRSGRENSVRLLVMLANTVLGLALLAALVWAGLKIVHAILVFSLGILVAYALEPLVTRLRGITGNRLPQGAAVFLVLFAFAIGLALVVAAAAGPTGRQIRDIEATSPQLRARADSLVGNADQWLAHHHITFRVGTAADQLTGLLRARGQALAQEALHAAGRIAAGLVDIALVIVVAVYFLVYSLELKQRLSKYVPALYQLQFQGLRRDMNQILGGFIRGQLVMAALMGLTAAIGCALLRLPFWILIGFFVALASLIPVVGAYVGAVPAVMLALLDPVNPAAKVVWVILLFVIVNEAGSKILYPRLVGSATGLHEVLVLFVLIAGAELGGIIGALLAVPVTALVGVVAVYAYRLWHQAQHPHVPAPTPPVVDATDEHRPAPPGRDDRALPAAVPWRD